MNKFTAEWDSLITGYQCPEWFRDAKFGVWSHWGPQAVPGMGDWYARHMYQKGTPCYNYHCRVYGHPSEFGYKDIIEQWTAEKFDAGALVDFFKENGAKYIVGQAAHCDNFDLFDSKHHSWNAVNHGPKRDILGEWCAAAKAAGLPFGFTEHLAWSYSWFNVNKGCDQTGPYAGAPYDGNLPEFQELYFAPHDDTAGEYPRNPSPAFVQNWQDRLKDAIDRYAPELFYTDGGIPFGETGLELMAYFYNQSIERNHGQLKGVYTYKDVNGRRPGTNLNIGEYRAGAGTEDLERGMLGEIMEQPWQTDTSSGPWFWKPSESYKSPTEIIHMLADIVSKNGNLLMNYTQRPDGSLDDETTWIVQQVGAWLKTNGEAIYGTRPWRTFGEGPTQFKSGEFSEDRSLQFTSSDFRFTQKGSTVYAIALGKPTDSWMIRSLTEEPIKHVSLLGETAPIEWTQTKNGLQITPPHSLLDSSAWALKIETS